MTRSDSQNRRAIESHQLDALRKLISVLLGNNRFYSDRLRQASIDADLCSLQDFTDRLPLTTKQQIVDDQIAHPPYGTNLTYPLKQYTRLCQTSATTGRPMRWLDTPDDWQWMLDNWKQVLSSAGVSRGDRALFTFSFGPFLGFWTAFEAALQIGLMVIPGGGMSSAARLEMLLENQVAVLFCTPTYAIRLGEVAAEQNIDLPAGRVRRIIVAGEPGGSLSATRRYIERLWPGALVFDHHGMTEVGPVSYQNPKRSGTLHIIESSYLAEILDPGTFKPVARGEPGELILTTLGRSGSPLLRYRTGDIVRQSTLSAAALGCEDLALDGGILGRADDMVIIRGVNVYPSSVEEIVRADHEVGEYRVEITESQGPTEMTLTVEPIPSCQDAQALCERLDAALRDSLQLRVSVEPTRAGALERFEMKAKRWHRSPRSDA